MKLMEAITQADSLFPNPYSMEQKIRWLSELDGKIKSEIMERHEEGGTVPFAPYGTETEPDTELLAKFPYDGLYIRYLEMQIDYAQGETDRYNNSAAAFEDAYFEYAKNYNRNVKPISRKRRFW